MAIQSYRTYSAIEYLENPDVSDRYCCATEICGLLVFNAKDGALVILDNADWYKNTAKLLRDIGFIEVDFHGFSHINGYTFTTSLFFYKKF